MGRAIEAMQQPPEPSSASLARVTDPKFVSDLPFPVSVVIVSYNSAHCIARALKSASGAAQCIVVDNASADDSIAIASAFGCQIIKNDRNRGFGVACNQAARAATCEFILFLNPDAVLAPNALRLMLAAAAANAEVVALGPRHELPADDEVQAPDRARLERARSRGVLSQPLAGSRTVDSLSGAALLCRRSKFAEIGGFDEKFFLYFEDEDLCRRLAPLGPLLAVNDATVFQLPGTGARLNLPQQFMKYRRYGRSRVYFTRKHGLRFKAGLVAIEQLTKGCIAIVRADRGRAMQHFGRAVGYIEGRLSRF
jgi:N-acetylglucosaminyl-diphospho-decaprenol L-rhamnosyltransferase